MAKSPEEEHPQKVFGWAARDSSGLLSPFHFSRRFLIFLSFYSLSVLVMTNMDDENEGIILFFYV